MLQRKVLKVIGVVISHCLLENGSHFPRNRCNRQVNSCLESFISYTFLNIVSYIFFVMVNLSVLLSTARVNSGVTRLLLLTSILLLEKLMGGLMYLLLVWDLQLQRMNFW